MKEKEQDPSMAFVDRYVCHGARKINSRGLWFSNNPLSYSVPLLLFQLSLISISTRSFYLLLKPLGQPSIVSQILGGITLGPSVLGLSSTFATKVFPVRGKNILETFSLFGFMLFIFQIGVKIDPAIIFKSGKRAVAIGVLSFLIPNALAGLTILIINQFLSLDHEISKSLPFVVVVQSLTSFPVISCFLAELEMLNSEIGRLACSSALVCDLLSWSLTAVKFSVTLAMTKSLKISVGSFFSYALLIAFILLGIRPGALWIIRRTPEDKSVKDIHIFTVLVALLVCGLLGEVVGINAFTASFLLGLVIPDGPPLGAAIVERLDCFVSVLLMPIFFTMCGLRTDIFAIQKLKNVGVIHLVVLVALFGKIVGTILPPLFCRMPFRDALALGLIMNSKGIIELAMLSAWKKENVMSDECYAVMILSVVIMTGVISPLVKALYDPSKRFLAYKRRTILHQRCDEELRILACIHRVENVQPIMDLLVVSNPTRQSPINLVVLHLVKLLGRSASLLTAHPLRERKSTQYLTQSEKIFNAFRKLVEHFSSRVIVNCYKGVSPYETMYNDVCSLALEKRTTFIIIPFHKQWINDGIVQVQSSHPLRLLNKNVLYMAPCSVGILIDRRISRSRSTIINPPFYRVAVLFFGGADDREALSYASRISELDNAQIILICFSCLKDAVGSSDKSKALDTKILSEFRLKAFRNSRVSYQEEAVSDGRAVLGILKSMKNDYDLVMVGRRHGKSWLMNDLKNWNEKGELGPVGEVLASKDFRSEGLILVVQQQTRLWGLKHPEEESTRLRRIKI